MFSHVVMGLLHPGIDQCPRTKPETKVRFTTALKGLISPPSEPPGKIMSFGMSPLNYSDSDTKTLTYPSILRLLPVTTRPTHTPTLLTYGHINYILIRGMYDFPCLFVK